MKILIKNKEDIHFLHSNIRPENVFTPEDFSDEHVMVSDLVTKFAVNEICPKLDKIENQEFSETVQLIKKAGELGLISADIPVEDGGLELGKVSAAIISEKIALGRSFSITFGGQTGIGALPIAYFGTENQKKQYLPDLLTGNKIAAYALTEPSSGSDALSAKTTAMLSECGTYYRLNGEKQWITNSAFADIFIVYAKVDGKKFTAFIVEKGYEGVSTGPEEKKMGLKGSSTRSLILDNVSVPVENVIGEIGRGHVIAFNVLNIGRYKIAASSFGTAKRAIELSISFSNERKQFGQPLSRFGLIQEKIADMTIKTYINESAIYRTAGAMQEAFEDMKRKGNDYGTTISKFALECSINKVMSTEILDFNVDEAVQIHGGYGYMADYEIETLYRDSRINRIFEGTNEINRIIIASTACKNYTTYCDSESKIDGPLIIENQILQTMKKLFHASIAAVQKQNLSDFQQEQETAAFIANLIINIYALESGILRTVKGILSNAKEENSLQIAYVKVYALEVAQQTGLQALKMGTYFKEEELFSKIGQHLIMGKTENVVNIKRQIANTIIKNGQYRS